MDTNVQKIFFEYLKAEGFRPRWDDDGGVIFRFKGEEYFTAIDKSFSDFFRLMCPIEIDNDIMELYEVASEFNQNMPVTKATVLAGIDNPCILITFEAFVSDYTFFNNYFIRIMEIIEKAKQMVMNKLK